MNKKLIITAFISLIIMNGCNTYKEYKRPQELSINESYRDVDEISDRSSLANLSWRELFTDSCLQALIDTGLVKNTDLQIARLHIEQSEAVLSSSRLAYLPSVNLSPEGRVSSFGGSKAAKTYSLAVSSSWEIDIFGKLTNQKREAVAAVESSKSYKQAVQTQLIATIANSYYTLLMLDKQLDISTSTLENWDSSIKTMEALKRAGQSNDAAILQARANRLALESSILSVKKSIHKTENSLSVLLGCKAQKIKRSYLKEQHFPETLSVGVPVQLLANRPDVRQAEHELARSFYPTNVARTAFYPSLTLGGSAGWTNSAGNSIVNPGDLLLSAVASLVQPLFNKGLNTANLRIAKAQQEESKLLFQQAILNAGQEVNDALVQWQTAQNQVEVTDQQISVLQQAVHKTELLMRHTSTNYLEVLTARQSLLQAENTQIQAQFDRIQGIINLYHALGGGKE